MTPTTKTNTMDTTSMVKPTHASDPTGSAATAVDFLAQASSLLAERGKTYDQPSGERAMRRTVDAFNAVTGGSMTEAQGWLFMLLLKQVRQWQKADYHHDSAEDGVAYAALLAESLAGGSRK